MDLYILYFKGSQVQISKFQYISAPEDCFFLTNSVDPDEIQHHVVFHLGLPCLPKCLFASIQNEMV